MAGYEIGRGRPSVARVAAVEYGPAGPPSAVSGVYHVTVTDRGRLVLPADIRERLKIRDGDRVAVTVEHDGTVTITTRDVALRRLRGMFTQSGKRRARASDELIAERRREAKKDDREFRAWNARLRKAGK